MYLENPNFTLESVDDICEIGETTTNFIRAQNCEMRELVVDETTRRLLELTSTKDRGPHSDEILSLLKEKASKLFDALTDINKEELVRTCQLRSFEFDQLVFEQGDFPDCYYVVLRGSVSIYRRQESKESLKQKQKILQVEEDFDKMKPNRTIYGRFLVSLIQGAGFGELSFNENGIHSKRNATVISEGSLGQARVETETTKNDGLSQEETNASNVAVLLLIPEQTYMRVLYTKHSSKHQTKDKISFLRKCILFQDWSYDDLVKISFAMRKRKYAKGSVISNQGDRFDKIFMISNGSIHISHKMTKISNKSLSNTEKDKDVIIEIAELSSTDHDIFGIVEIINGSKKYKRKATALTDVETYSVDASDFLSFFKHNPDSIQYMRNLAKRRNRWENLRRDFSQKFSSSIPLKLPKNAIDLSNYSLSKSSILSGGKREETSSKK